MTKLWCVRAGKHGEREHDAVENGRLYPGFLEKEDLSRYNNLDEILTYLESIRPDEGRNRLKNYAAQRNQFVNQFKSGDYVVMPQKISREIVIGQIEGKYQYDPLLSNGYRHFWPIRWISEFPRDLFKQDILYSLGAFLTVFEVKRNSALERVSEILRSGRDPGPNLGSEGKIRSDTDHSGVNEGEETDNDAAAFTSIEELAQDQIENRINSEFKGHDLAELVNAILKADGYLTRVSPPGPDGGVDILAAKGSLGFESDTICIQVKSGKKADKNVVLQLDNSISKNGAQKGLLVSVGGVDKGARTELDLNYFKIRLWQLSDLLDNLYRTYNKLPEEIRAKLNLKQIWIPIPVEDE